MLNSQANLDVVLFFLFGSVIFALVGYRFWSIKENPFKDFGIALVLFSLAFLGWGVIVATHPEPLDKYVSFAVVPFVFSFLFFVSSATFNWKKENRKMTFAIAVTYFVILFALRTWVYPSTPNFSDKGLIYFNAEPPILILYIIAFAGTFMPALHVVSSRITQWRQSALTRIFFNLIILSGVILLTSKDDQLQYLNGFVLCIGLIGLMVLYFKNKVQIANS